MFILNNNESVGVSKIANSARVLEITEQTGEVEVVWHAAGGKHSWTGKIEKWGK